MRYLIGVLLSLFGTFLIISNEKENNNSNNPNLENKSLLIGCLIAMTHLTLLSFINSHIIKSFSLTIISNKKNYSI